MRVEESARQAAEAARFRAGTGPGRVDVFAVIRRLGIHLLRIALPQGSLEGAFVRHGDEAFILVNTASWPTRQRFTAAHELGHFFLGQPDDKPHYDVTLWNPEDRKANLFAGFFLMDEQTAKSIVEVETEPVRMALLLMNEFDVSFEAAAIHLCDLGIIESPVKRHLLDISDDQSVSLAGLAREHGVPKPRVAKPDETVDPGEDYLSAIAELRATGLLSDKAYEEMSFNSLAGR